MNKQSKRIKDILGVISKQKRYSTLAKKEGDYASKKEKQERKAGMTEEAKDSKREKEVAYNFEKIRKGWVAQEKKKLPKAKSVEK